MGILTTNLSCFGGKVAGHPCVFFCIKTIKVSWWAWACPEMGDIPKWFWGGTWYTNHCSVLGLLAYVQTNLRCVFSYYWYLWWFQRETILTYTIICQYMLRVQYFQDNPSSNMTLQSKAAMKTFEKSGKIVYWFRWLSHVRSMVKSLYCLRLLQDDVSG